MSLQISLGELKTFFPAFIKLTSSDVIDAYGPSIERHVGQDLRSKLFFDEFDVEHPWDAKALSDLTESDQTIVFRHRVKKGLKLRGAVIQRESESYLLVSHAPAIDDGEDVLRYQYADFSPFDCAQDLFLASQIRKGLLDDAEALVAQLKKEKMSAEAANIAKSNFLACMSHEIRTPLNGVLGMASALADTGLTEAQEELLTIIEQSGEVLLTLLNDILDLSKVEAGKLEISPTAFKIRELIGGIEKVYKLKCDEKGVSFLLSVDSALTEHVYIGDCHRMRQILNNLVSNAVKFTSAGQVAVRVWLEGDKANPKLSFSVADTGIGMCDKQMKRLFTPFVQADSSTTRQFGGTGLGLSISKELCELMGGSIKARSEHGRGSVFEFHIPVGQEAGVASTACA